MGRNLYARLVAYKAAGDRIGVLPQPSSWQALVEFDESGSLTFDYAAGAVGGDITTRALTDGTEIAVEVSDGGEWTEPPSMRYLVIKREGDQTDPTGTVTFTCVSYGWLLNKIRNLNTDAVETDGDNKGQRPFLSANAGTIIRTFLQENAERGGAANHIGVGFDTGKDSSGTAWSRVQTLYYSTGVTLKTAMDSMVQGTVIDWDTQGRTIRVWNADNTQRSRDLSREVVVQLARDVTSGPFEETIEDTASHILVTGDNGLVFTEDNPATPAPWGKWESYVSQGGVSDEGTAKAFMQATLEQASRVRGSYTRGLLVSDANHLPFIDYQPGDWITAPTVNHGEKVRVRQLKLNLDNTNGAQKITCSVTLNDALTDPDVRQNKKLNGISGGAALAGSESSRPAPAQDHRVPAAPQGLVVDTDAYIDENGWARGLAVATWGEVTEATDDTAIDITSYEVQWRRNIAGAPWMRAGWTDETTLAWSDMDCGIMIEVRVRAIPQYSDKSGEWSDVVVVEVASDVTPPSVPSRPVLSSDMGGVIVHWDGLNESGGGMESDFDHLVVSRGQSTGDMTVIDAEATGKGDWLDFSGLTPGSTYYYAIAAVDHAGNQSDWSEVASVTVVSAVSQEQVDQIREDLDQARDDLDQAQSDLTEAGSRLDGLDESLAQAGETLEQTGATLDQATQDITQLKGKTDEVSQQAAQAIEDALNAQKTADGRNRIYRDWQDPRVTDPTLVPVQGDLWYQYQRYWTTSLGEPDNSPSALADFYTYAEGEPDNSPSVLVPLDSQITHVWMWNGSDWETYNLVAQNVIAYGSVVADNLAVGAVTADKILAGAVTTEKLAALSVDASKLTANAVTADKIAANSVSSDKIAANAVTTGKLAALAVTADKLAANAVTAGKIAANAVTTDKLAANSVTGVKIAARTITADRIAAGVITSYELKAGAVTADKIAAGAITANKLAADAITGKTITGCTINGGTINSTNSKGTLRMSNGTIRAYPSSGAEGGYISFGVAQYKGMLHMHGPQVYISGPQLWLNCSIIGQVNETNNSLAGTNMPNNTNLRAVRDLTSHGNGSFSWTNVNYPIWQGFVVAV